MAAKIPPEDYPIRRVLFRLSLLHLDFSQLEIAARLASERQAELIAFCVENLELLRSSQLPFTGQIGLATGRRLPWQEDQLERQLTRMRQRLRDHLDHFARQQPLRWKMIQENARSDSPPALSAADELLVLSRALIPNRDRPAGTTIAGDLSGGGKGPVLLLAQRPGAVQFVVVLVTEPERERRLLAIAESMARLTGKPLNILCTGTETTCSALAREYRDRRRAVNLLRADGSSVRVLEKLAVHGRYLLVLSGQTYGVLAPGLPTDKDVLIVPDRTG